MQSVKIYQLSKGFETWIWLCQTCLKEREREGWERKATKEPPHELTCDDCRGDA